MPASRLRPQVSGDWAKVASPSGKSAADMAPTWTAWLRLWRWSASRTVAHASWGGGGATQQPSVRQCQGIAAARHWQFGATGMLPLACGLRVVICPRIADRGMGSTAAASGRVCSKSFNALALVSTTLWTKTGRGRHAPANCRWWRRPPGLVQCGSRFGPGAW